MILGNNENFDTIINNAKQRATQMVENGLYSRFHLQKQERIEKATIGCIGEIAFQQLLESNAIPYQLDQTDFSERNSDEFDFLVNGNVIDVKVAKKSTSNYPTDHWTYGYPEEQKPFKKDYIIIGWIDFNNKEVGFYGWITGNEVARYSVVKNNSYKGYRYLTPNHEFKWGELNKDFKKLWNNLEN